MIDIIALRASGPPMTGVPVRRVPALLADPEVVVWIDIAGLPDEDAHHLVREVFRFHPLAIDDCFEQRVQPKIDGFGDHVFLITHGMTRGSTGEDAEVIELDAFLGARFLVTYHERESRSVAVVRDVVLRDGGPMRRGSAALLHAILDRQAHGIETVIDDLEARLERLEERILERPRREDLGTLVALKRNEVQLRRWISKQREVVQRLARGEFGIVPTQDQILFRDLYDELLRLGDLVESYRDMTSSLQDTYMSVTNLRLGEIVKYLTLYTATLMPLTVITGIYGMNFAHMPELDWRLGYPMVLAIMLATGLGVVWFFRRKGWIDRGPVGGRVRGRGAMPRGDR